MKKLLFFLLLWSVSAHAYIVGPPPTLDTLDKESDVIFKGVALETLPVKDTQISPQPGFSASETRFRVISALKGELKGEIRFRHYSMRGTGFMYIPNHIHFEMEKPYLVWAKRGKDGQIRHFSDDATLVESGVMRAGDKLPVAGSGTSAVWRELQVMLKIDKNAQLYAIRRMSDFSGSSDFFRFSQKADFDSDQIWPLLTPFLNSQAVGEYQPVSAGLFPSNRQIPLAAAAIRALHRIDSKRAAPDALRLARDAKLPAVRAAALEVLSGSRDARAREIALRTLAAKNGVPERVAALRVVAKFSDDTAIRALETATKSLDKNERIGAIAAIGISKSSKLLDELETLTADSDEYVRRNAAETLLEFPHADAQFYWVRQTKNPVWATNFQAALAAENPLAFRAQLREILTSKGSQNLSGISVVSSAWKSLVQTLTLAPEVPASDFDLLEKSRTSSSSDWHQLYRAYLLRGETTRAQNLKTIKTKEYGEGFGEQLDWIDKEFGFVRPGETPKKLAEGFIFTEGPVWFPKMGDWLFSDIPADTIFRLTPTGVSEPFLKPSFNSNGNAVLQNGDLISCQHGARRVAKWDGKSWTTLADRFEGKRLNSPNDLAIHSGGAIYFTDPSYGVKKDERELDFTGLYRLSSDGKVQLLDKEWEQPNGICFSPDEKRLYVNDSQAGKLFAFDVKASGALENKTLLATIPKPGDPDGMKCDQLGRIWIGGPGGVQVFGPSGALLQKISLGKSGANLAFGGSDGKTLLVTARGEIWTIELNVREGKKR